MRGYAAAVAEPNNDCLLVIDTQRGLDDPSYGARSTPTAERNMARLLKAWRDASRPVVHVRHLSVRATSPLRPDGPGVDFKPEALPLAGEEVYDKSTNSAFIGTTLEEDLRARGIDTLVVAGLTTDHCVSSTVRMAADLGFAVIVVADACATHERRGHDGQLVSAADMHRSALASLSGEFAAVLDTDAILRA